MIFRFNRIVYEQETGGGGGGTPPSAAGGGGVVTPPPSPTGGAAAPAPAFAETLPEDIRAEAAFRDIKDLGGLAKSYLHATKMIGGRPEDLIKLPTSPDDKDAWGTIYSRLGRPETHDKYVLTPPQGAQFTDADKAFHAAILPVAHEAGLNQRQLDRLATAFTGFTGGLAQQQQQQAQAAIDATAAALKTEWGQAYDQNLGLAKQAIRQYGGDELLAEVDRSGLGNLPAVAKLFAKLGGQLAEDGVIGRAGAGGAQLYSPTEARQQIAGKYADKDFATAYRDGRHPGHKDAVATMQRLYEMAYPQQTAA